MEIICIWIVLSLLVLAWWNELVISNHNDDDEI